MHTTLSRSSSPVELDSARPSNSSLTWARAAALRLSVASLCVGTLQAQSADSAGPYHLSLAHDAALLGAGAATSTIGLILYSNTPDITLGEVELDGINKFDQIASDFNSDKAANVSDYFMYGSGALPFALLLDPAVREDAGTVGLMYAETFLLTTGLTTLIKSTTQRARPYVYEEGLPPETVLDANDRAAFLSGHTSVSAAGAFFTAKVYADYHPDDPSRYIVWTAAALIPATTGFLRVRSGRHYPTDTIAGYALGAGVGVLVPTLHKSLPKVKVEGLSLVPLPAGMYASLTF